MAATLKCDTIQNAGSATVNAYLDGNGNLSVGNSTSPSATSTGNINASGTVIMGSSFLRNRIINGAMVIDQRNAGASVTVNTGTRTYGVDRFFGFGVSAAGVFTQQQSTDTPTGAGYVNSTKVTVTTSATPGSGDVYGYGQAIEGNNVADLMFGSASAKTITLSFWVKSSLTGTFTVVVANYGGSRTYPATFTINAANTWEQKSITVSGDTTGTWLTNNSEGISLLWIFGTGSSLLGTANTWAASKFGVSGQTNIISTNGATFYITGVQLEVGSVATPFERRQYGQELALCQRYYYRQTPAATTALYGQGLNDSTTAANGFVAFPVPMRTAPTALEQSGTATHYRVQITGNVINCSAVPTFNSADTWFSSVVFTVASGLTPGQASLIRAGSTSGYLGWSAEL